MSDKLDEAVKRYSRGHAAYDREDGGFANMGLHHARIIADALTDQTPVTFEIAEAMGFVRGDGNPRPRFSLLLGHIEMYAVTGGWKVILARNGNTLAVISTVGELKCGLRFLGITTEAGR